MLPHSPPDLERLSMPSPHRSFVSTASLRRPAGPRCHGGASSLLRPAITAARTASRLGAWREQTATSDDAVIEHVVGWPARADRGAPIAS
jgi:hypothetical protein